MNLMEHKTMDREELRVLMLTAQCIGDLIQKPIFHIIIRFLFAIHLTLKLYHVEEEALKVTEEGEKPRISIRILCYNEYFPSHIVT